METTEKSSNNLLLDMSVVRKLLVDFIHDEVLKTGFSKGIIGVSGGIDSAVAITLATEALGKKNVLAVLMPYKTSNPSSIADAQTLVKRLGIKSETVDITSMVDAHLNGKRKLDNVRKGNIMARQRMIVLYDISAREHALVIGTSNKTELLLGYGTMFGDVACAINPIGDLYKTQVRQLAKELRVPKRIIEKKPSADLWQGQTDEEELGFTYKLVDQLLYSMIDERRTDKELQQLGFKKKFIGNVRNIVQKNQFKRRLPLIAKVSHRTLNIDFRYARDWGL